MKAGKSYIKDTSDFLVKLKNLGNIPSNAILVTADVVGLYHSIPHSAVLQALYEKLEEGTHQKNPSTDLLEMTEFILKNNLFEFETKIIHKFLKQPSLELSLLLCFLWIEWKTTFLTQKLLSHRSG